MPLFVCFFALCLCVSVNALPGDSIAGRPLGEAVADDHWITYPREGGITVVGIAGRRRNQDEAVAEALLDAARKISLYHGVSGESVTVLNAAQNALDYFADSEYRLVFHHEPEEYAESLVFNRETDVAERNGSVYVRVRYNGISGIDGWSAQTGGVPRWVREQSAEIPGYLAGVGGSKNKGTAQRTHRASYENAIAALLPGLSTQVDTSVVEAGGAKITRSTAYSKGVFAAALILETFYDKSTGVLWTLVAAKE